MEVFHHERLGALSGGGDAGRGAGCSTSHNDDVIFGQDGQCSLVRSDGFLARMEAHPGRIFTNLARRERCRCFSTQFHLVAKLGLLRFSGGGDAQTLAETH